MARVHAEAGDDRLRMHEERDGGPSCGRRRYLWNGRDELGHERQLVLPDRLEIEGLLPKAEWSTVPGRWQNAFF